MTNAQLALTGSKRKRRRAEAAERLRQKVDRDLNRVYQLSKLIASEQELDTYLAAIADDEVRAATKKLIEPFLLFRIQRTDKPLVESAEKATVAGYHPEIVRPVLPTLS